MEYGNPPYRRTLSNHNKLLGMYDGAIGVKTGFTKKAGRCLVAASEKNGILLVSVTLNAPSDWEDHEKLLDYGYSRLKRFDLPGGLGGKSLPVVGAGEPDAEVSLRADSASVAADEAEFSRIERRYQIPAFLYAPVRRDVQIGCVEYYLDGKKVAAAGIYADEDVPAASPGAPYYRRRFWFWLSKLLLP